MKKILFTMFCLVVCFSLVFAKNTTKNNINSKVYDEKDYKKAVNIIKDCYSKVKLNDRNINDSWMWGKETKTCSKCNQMLLRKIEFIHTCINDNSMEQETVVVETCKNKNCKYFATYQTPLHKIFPSDEYKEVNPICLYEGSYVNLDDVLLEGK
jgi:hypothetical protein